MIRYPGVQGWRVRPGGRRAGETRLVKAREARYQTAVRDDLKIPSWMQKARISVSPFALGRDSVGHSL